MHTTHTREHNIRPRTKQPRNNALKHSYHEATHSTTLATIQRAQGNINNITTSIPDHQYATRSNGRRGAHKREPYTNTTKVTKNKQQQTTRHYSTEILRPFSSSG